MRKPLFFNVFTIIIFYFSKTVSTVKKPNRYPRIVNGWEAVPGQAPFIVSLQTTNSVNLTEHFCTGSYIGDGWIITASHCVKSM